MIPYEILIRGTKDGKLSGSHVIDTFGADARPITTADLSAIAPAINAAAIATADSIAAEKDAEIATLTESLTALESLRDNMVSRVTEVLQSGDPEQFAALAVDFLTPAQEKLRSEKMAQLEALQAEIAALQ